MTPIIQPPGTMHCGYYAIRNAHILLGFPDPGQEALAAIPHHPAKDGSISEFCIAEILRGLGWEAMTGHFGPKGDAGARIRHLHWSGATLFISHGRNHPTYGHWVVVSGVREHGTYVVCSAKGTDFVPYRLGLDGIRSHLVIAWPDGVKR